MDETEKTRRRTDSKSEKRGSIKVPTSHPDELTETNSREQTEDKALKAEERRKKAKRRTKGPYRKAHANW